MLLIDTMHIVEPDLVVQLESFNQAANFPAITQELVALEEGWTYNKLPVFSFFHQLLNLHNDTSLEEENKPLTPVADSQNPIPLYPKTLPKMYQPFLFSVLSKLANSISPILNSTTAKLPALHPKYKKNIKI